MSELVRILPVCRFALNIRMVSAPLSNMLRLFIELTILGMFLYYDLNKMFGIEKTSQNGQFFIKSSILVLRSQHPHGICPPAEHVHSASRADWKWFILGAVYYRS